jgi:uncharacterized protein
MMRLIAKRIDEWITARDRKVLLLHGARQTGKTHLINSIAKKFDQFLSFNLSIKKERKVFENQLSLEDLLQAMFSMKGKNQNKKKTLVFLDNITDSPSAEKWLPRFREDVNDIYVIASSSRLMNAPDKTTDSPGTPIHSLLLRPYNFSEFLVVLGEDSARDAFHEVPFPNNSFDKLIRFFHLYTLIGGMPEIVENYARDRELADLQPIYEKIMTLFQEESDKISPSKKSRELNRKTFQNAFPYASMRISFHHFGNTLSRSREAGKSFRTLEELLLLNLIYPCTSTHVPIHPDKNKSPRLQMIDTGLVNYSTGIQKQIFEVNDLLLIFDGQIGRHVVGQEILASGTGNVPGLNFWVRSKAQSTAEVNYIIPYEDLLIPVVLKPGEPGRLRSLHQFMDAAPHPFAVRLWAHPLSIQQATTIKGKKFFLMSLPYFLAGKISEHLEGFIRLVKS